MASVWREPIFDRTPADVAFAIQKIAEWTAYNISAAEYDEKVRIENEELILREGYAATTNDKLILQGDGRAYVEKDELVVRLGVVYDLKGCLNLIDIKRIEDNIAYLSDRLREYAYPSEVSTREWSKERLPNEKDVQRIINNVKALITAFYQSSDAPPLPVTMLSYSDINSIERNIDLIKYLLDCMVSSFRKAGASKSGTQIRLPIRR